MRRVSAALVVLLFAAAHGAAHYPINVSEVRINLMKPDASLVNSTLLQKELWLFEGNITVETTPIIPTQIRGYLEGHSRGAGNSSCYTWEDLVEIGNRLDFFRADRLDILLVANLPCKTQEYGCFCGTEDNLAEHVTKRHIRTNLAMAEVDALLNATQDNVNKSAALAPLIVQLAEEAGYPPIEGIDLGQVPMLTDSEFVIKFVVCQGSAELEQSVGALNSGLPSDVNFEYEVSDCSDVQYGNLVTADSKASYLFSNPGFFGTDGYGESNRMHVALVHSLEEFDVFTPFFAAVGQEGDFTSEQVAEILSQYIGLEQSIDPLSITQGSGTPAPMDRTRIGLIFREWRRNVDARDALLRIGFINRLNSSLVWSERGSLDFYPDFRSSYSLIVKDFKEGRYIDSINRSSSFIELLESQGYWNEWADSVWPDIEEIQGDLDCVECGEGCYSGEGVCCNRVFHSGGNCCQGDCPLSFTCVKNRCAFNWTIFASSIASAGLLVVPPFLLVLVLLLSRNKIKEWRIKKMYRELKRKGFKEDKIYFKLFQQGYKKQDVERVFKDEDEEKGKEGEEQVT